MERDTSQPDERERPRWGGFFFEDKKTSDNKNTKIQKEDMTKNKGNPI